MIRTVAGVDPGLGGAIALVDLYGALLGVADMPHADGRVLAGELADVLAQWAPSHVRIELAQAMPDRLRGRRQGSASTFRFGRAFGTVEGVVEALKLPSSTVTAAQWKKRMHVTADKKSSLALAQRVWPRQRETAFKLVKHAGRAEAALIAADYVRTCLGHWEHLDA